MQAGRLLTGWRREPVVLVQSLIFPTFLLIVYKLVIGESILNLTGDDSLYGLVPICAVTGALFGAMGTGVAIPDERESGLLSRLWVLPVNRASALTGRLPPRRRVPWSVPWRSPPSASRSGFGFTKAGLPQPLSS